MAPGPGDAQRPVTMRDVAAAAGVGIATVSRVLSGAPGVRPALVDRVRTAAAGLGYRRDTAASSLRRSDRRSGTLGLVLGDVANPFAAAVYRAVEDAALARGMLALAGSSDERADREREVIATFLARRVDGLIVMPSGAADAALAALAARGTPVVCVDRPAAGGAGHAILSDNRGGVRDAVGRLHAAGHRHVAFLGDRSRLWTAVERHGGYLEAAAAAGIAVRAELVRQDVPDEAAAQAAVDALLDLPRPPTALFSAQNLLTLGARRQLQRRGAHRRVAHIGFDDVPLADLLDPPVSVVAQDPARLGREAAASLFALLDGAAEHRPRRIVLPTRYIARGSGELAPP